MNLLSYIAKHTHYDAYEGWVEEHDWLDRDGCKTKHPFVVPIFDDRTRNKDTPPKPNVCHCADNIKYKHTITPSFVLAWISILIINGAYFNNANDQQKIYRKAPHDISLLYIENSMPCNSFEFMSQYIHFVDNVKKKKRDHPNYDPLYKIKYVLKELMKGMKQAWTTGMRVTIDQSMIKFCGRAIAFIQYMPAKPIKYGVKGFALCCPYSAVLLRLKYLLVVETNKMHHQRTKIKILPLILSSNLLIKHI